VKKKWAVAAIAVSMFASMGVGAYAASNLQEIKAYLNPGLSFKVNGKPFSLQDGNGGTLAPITYNNTTYLPIRAVSDALDVAVHYDNASKMIQLGEMVDGVSIADGFDDTFHTKDPAKTVYDGKDYHEVYLNNSDGNRSASFMLYPKGKYQKLYLQIAAIGKDIDKLLIQDSDNDIELKTTTVSIGDGLKTVEVDIGGVDSLWIDAEASNGGTVFVPLTTSYYK
jgi:hypothetical protein